MGSAVGFAMVGGLIAQLCGCPRCSDRFDDLVETVLQRSDPTLSMSVHWAREKNEGAPATVSDTTKNV